MTNTCTNKIKCGLIKWMSIQVLEISRGNMFAMSMVIIWFSAFASAIVDNIPYVARMNPLIIDRTKQLWPNISGVHLLYQPDLMPVWWPLALGACLGGNGTAIGASLKFKKAQPLNLVSCSLPFDPYPLYVVP
jgi:Na+/H+ antiporter NhaD/arsenite permease-like protein